MYKVIELEDELTIWPTQWIGMTNDNKYLYFRYKYGELTVTDITNGFSSNYIFVCTYGDMYSAMLTLDELLSLLPKELFDFSDCKYIGKNRERKE